ncbi:MAG TPA: choice-of-anchor tandem repeat GloVer-containing protein [Terriglobales bacterium]|nr:choice-of-anchor tandem repeat GloVer-containing protein [Terriglobales bacterium]
MPALLVLVLCLGAWAQTATVLHSFASTMTDGYSPTGGLLIDRSGDLFGTTLEGSTTPCDNHGNVIYGCGNVYELVKGSSGYKESILYSFGSSSQPNDGASPFAGLIMDNSGDLFGTTQYGGGSDNCLVATDIDGCGTVFELAKSASGYTESVLYAFTGADGGYPSASLTMDSSGDLYGTTYSGGACGHGEVFEMVHSSGGFTERILHSFGCTSTDGWSPAAGLTMDAAGNLYGTAEGAGDLTACQGAGCGIVFELANSNGSYSENVLYSFTGADGWLPDSSLVIDTSGSLYGTTERGGANNNGTVFELVKASGSYSERVLYSFEGPKNGDGQSPEAGLVLDAKGNLYGTTWEGGSGCGTEGCGTVFELANAAGAYTEKVVHRFGLTAGDGEMPATALVMDGAGNFYGTTNAGGGTNSSGGTVFEINPTAIAPSMIFSSAPVNFGEQAVNMSTLGESVAVTNSGSASLNFGSEAVTLSGANAADFTVGADTCSGASLAPMATCAVTVAFRPSILGDETASLNFNENATSSPQTVVLAGTGTPPPVVTLSPTSVSFSSEPVGYLSAPQTITLVNSGGPLSIYGITASANFEVLSNGCIGTPEPAESSCALSVIFAPTATGPLNGTLSVADDASGSPQTVALSGTAVAAGLSPAALQFGAQLIGATTTPATVELTNAGGVALTNISIVVSGNFAETNNCGESVAAGARCVIAVTFTPTATGTSNGTLTVADNAPGTPQTVALSGTGSDLVIAAASGSSTSATVSAGQTATYELALTPISGLTGTFNLRCTGAPNGALCTPKTASISISGATPIDATVTVSTTARSNFLSPTASFPTQPWMWLAGLGLLGLASVRLRRKRLAASVFAALCLSIACGGGGSSGGGGSFTNSGTPTGTYVLTFTVASATGSRSLPLSLTVE